MGNRYISPIYSGYLWIIIPRIIGELQLNTMVISTLIGVHPSLSLEINMVCFFMSSPNLPVDKLNSSNTSELGGGRER